MQRRRSDPDYSDAITRIFRSRYEGFVVRSIPAELYIEQKAAQVEDKVSIGNDDKAVAYQ